MVRVRSKNFQRQRRSPHPRGDGPASAFLSASRKGFSPPAWGWSVVYGPTFEPGRVLPTRVGMVRLAVAIVPDTTCSPHPRGDGPASVRLRRWERENDNSGVGLSPDMAAQQNVP